jgi:hypothetical protein
MRTTMDNFLSQAGFVLKTMDKDDVLDDFFSSFKNDYSDFESWFISKSEKNDLAFYYYENNKIVGFIKLKIENSKHIKLCSFKLESIAKKQANTAFESIHSYAKSNKYETIYATGFPNMLL